MPILPPPFGVPTTDPKTGKLSAQWQAYYLSLGLAVTSDFAPVTSPFITWTASADLTNEVNLGSLATGYLRITTTIGNAVPSTTTTIPAADIAAGTANISITGTAAGGTAGNAATATALQTARTINGVSFNGTANITVTASANTLTGSALPALDGAALTNLTGANVFHQVTTITSAASPYAVLPSDETILVNAVGGAVTLDLPATVVSGRIITVKKIDAGANVVTVDANADTIDGAATFPLAAQWNSVTIQGNGANWFVIAQV